MFSLTIIGFVIKLKYFRVGIYNPKCVYNISYSFIENYYKNILLKFSIYNNIIYWILTLYIGNVAKNMLTLNKSNIRFWWIYYYCAIARYTICIFVI